MRHTPLEIYNAVLMDQMLKDVAYELGHNINTYKELADVICCDCGIELLDVHPKTLRCPACSYKRKRLKDKEYKHESARPNY